MTSPAILADDYYSADSYALAPSGQGDGPRYVRRIATIPDNTSVGTIIGLVPFQKGARVAYSSKIITSDLDTDTTCTINVGYVYEENDTTTNINDEDAFIATGSVASAAVLSFTAVAGATFVATANGWVTATVAGSAVVTAGTLEFDGLISYQT